MSQYPSSLFIRAATILSIALTVTSLSADINMPGFGRGWLNYYAPGIIRPDQGTVEMTIQPSQDSTQFGNAWDFVFRLLPAQPAGGNTLLGVLFPSLEYGESGIRLVSRAQRQYCNVNYRDIRFKAGDKLNVAFSWGNELRLYINGKRVGAQSYTTPIAPMPAIFSVQRGNPFHVQSVKISSIQLSDEQLTSDPKAEFQADGNTTFLASDRLTRTKTFETAWQKESGFSAVIPYWSPATQCFVQGQTVSYPLLTVNHGPSPKTYKIHQTFTTTDKQIVSDYEKDIVVAANQSHTPAELPLADLSGRADFYHVRTTITDEQGQTQTYDSSIAVIPSVDKGAPDGTLSQYLGYHWNFDYDPLPLQQMGVSWVRLWGVEPLLWFSVEPMPDGWQWDQADALVKLAKSRGLHLLGLLGNPPRWAVAEPPKEHQARHPLAQVPSRWKPRNVDEWKQYVTEVVKRYHGDIHHWEIYNEADFHPPGLPASFSGSTAEYFDLLKGAYQSAKQSDPSAQMLTSGFSLGAVCDRKMPFDLLEMGAAYYFDIFNMHSYQGLFEVDDLLKTVRARKPDAPFWQTEQAWLTIANQGNRLFLTPAIYLWFLDKGYAKYFQFGMADILFTKETLSPTLDHYVIAVFQNQLRSCERYLGRCKFEGDGAFTVKHQMARTDGKTLTVLGAENATYRISTSTPIERVLDIMGHTIPVETTDGISSFKNSAIAYVLSPTPLVITQVTQTQAAPLMVNGGFEEVQGDITMGGLDSGKPLAWTFRDTTYDSRGKIKLSADAHTGKLAVSVHAKTGRVYLFQESRIPAPGTYRLTAYLKKPATDQSFVAQLSVYDHGAGKVWKRAINALTPGYAAYSFDVTFDQVPEQAAALIVGIDTGEGDLLIDDVTFEKVQPTRIPDDQAKTIDLESIANRSLTDEIKANISRSIHLTELTRLGSGMTHIDGVPFLLPDAQGKCLIVAGEDWPDQPRRITGIPVNQCLAQLAFLHTAMYVNAGDGQPLGQYVIHYDDGTQAGQPILNERNVRDWWTPGHKENPQAQQSAATFTSSQHSEMAVYNCMWSNPYPAKKITSIDMIAKGNAMLCLLAITGRTSQ
ncbi:MAG: endo-1,4-beta-xylanase [Phycisphaerales bacterium]